MEFALDILGLKRTLRDVKSEFFPLHFSATWAQKAEALFFSLLRLVGLVRTYRELPLCRIPLRTRVFIKEARKQDFSFTGFFGPAGFINYFLMEKGKKSFLFQGLPLAGVFSRHMDDKWSTKKFLKKAGVPVLKGGCFWFFQKKKGLRYAKKRLGFPVVVKPRTGSGSACVTADIRRERDFLAAAERVVADFPCFMVEKYLPGAFVYRATVVGRERVFCVKQIPANVVGDGEHPVSELVSMKNENQKRGKPEDRTRLLCKVVINEKTKQMLAEKGRNICFVPKKGERVFIQEDSFLKLGGDLVEVTSRVHPQNLSLFRKVARLFKADILGIDFLGEDIALPWEKQACGVLEANSLPCIEMHHFPNFGKSRNPARSLLKITKKRYF